MKNRYLKIMRGLSLHPQLDFLIRKGRQVPQKRRLQIFVLALALATSLAGLGAAIANPSVTALAAQPVQGIYEISFFADTLEGLVPLTNNSLPVLTELVLKAHVEDTSGHPVKRGSVIFQDCLLKGNPAPSAACVSGSGAWSHLITLPIDQFGNALVDYGFVSTPRTTIGFRFRYIGQGSGIANSPSASGDVTWF
jgi:hypothetical protein